jgi:CO/xanthine dehydrogenase FAD-binding subunit
MRPFVYESPSSAEEAASRSAPDSLFIAGGTTVIDLMKLEVMKPARLVDVNALPMRGVEMREDGLRIGALEKMSGVALHPEIVANYPVISQALLQSASPQIRNMASMGGNLLQRTRCGYFRDVTTPCHKREPGSDCSAINGHKTSVPEPGPSWRLLALIALKSRLREFALNLGIQRCRLHPPPEARLQCPASLPPSRKLLSPPRKNLSRSPFATKNRPSSA